MEAGQEGRTESSEEGEEEDGTMVSLRETVSR
jgi:hypothetical protein